MWFDVYFIVYVSNQNTVGKKNHGYACEISAAMQSTDTKATSTNDPYQIGVPPLFPDISNLSYKLANRRIMHANNV